MIIITELLTHIRTALRGHTGGQAVRGLGRKHPEHGHNTGGGGSSGAPTYGRGAAGGQLLPMLQHLHL